MFNPHFLAQDAARLDSLYQYEILDTPSESVFDDLVCLAAQFCQKPIALINFIDCQRQRCKASIGWNLAEMPIDSGFCPHTIGQPEQKLIIPDARVDNRFANNPLVTGEPYIRFYAGVALITPNNQLIGTLCVMDSLSGTITPQQVDALTSLGRQVVSHLESRRELISLNRRINEYKLTAVTLQPLKSSLQAILNSRLHVVVFLDKQLKIQVFNHTAQEWFPVLFGKEIKQGDAIAQFVAPGHVENFRKNIAAAFQGELVSLEKCFPAINNQQYWFKLNYCPVFDEQSTVIGVCYVAVNIDKEKSAFASLAQNEERFRELAEHIHQIFWIASADGKEILYISPGFERIFDITCEYLYQHPKSWLDCVHPDDREYVKSALVKQIQQPDSKYDIEYRIQRRDGLIRWIHAQAFLVRNQEGVIYRFAGIAEDITNRKLAEQQIQASLQEKEILLKEIHHRVKNNLQIISSLLNLQAAYIKDAQALSCFKESQSRVRTIAFIHEQLYQSNNLSQINFAEYLQNLVGNLFRTYGVNSSHISYQINVEDVFLSVDIAIPCALIINELVSNCLKYAFPSGKSGEIYIALVPKSNNKNLWQLTLGDNGVGFSSNIDLNQPKSLGLKLVNTLTKQLKGSLKLNLEDVTEFQIEFENTASPS